MTAALAVRRLTSGYAGSTVVNGLDFDIGSAHGVVTLLGRNGAGKTTFVHAVMGLVQPSGGSVQLDGVELAGRTPDAIARAGISLAPRGDRLFSPLTVAEHLTIAERFGRRGNWNRARVLDLLPRLGDRLGHRADQLSGGERQMLAIAWALLANPRLLLFDEPSDGLAPAMVAHLGTIIRSLAGQGIGILLVEQNLRLAFAVAQRVAVMEKGRIVLDTSVADFRANPDRARALLGLG
ncbi:MAG: ABC transporter ATP-binding protein [Thermomicrobiales bacterium]